MGYTHYWRLEPTIVPTEANIMIGEILGRAYTQGIVQRDYDDTREPILSDPEIQFNGVGDNGQETFFTIPSGGEQADSEAFRKPLRPLT